MNKKNIFIYINKTINFFLEIIFILLGLFWFLLGSSSIFRLTNLGATSILWDSIGGIASELAIWWTFIGIVLFCIIAIKKRKKIFGKISIISGFIGVFFLVFSIIVSIQDMIYIQKNVNNSYGITKIKLNNNEIIKAIFFPLKTKDDEIQYIKNISYGINGDKNMLDIILPKTKQKSNLPILLHVHGGGMISGEKGLESMPLLVQMAKSGWMVVTINYRLGPKDRWPSQIDDIKQAINWIKQNSYKYGGNKDFIAGVGGSAGGYLLSLIALSDEVNNEDISKTLLQAVVSMYGIYDMSINNIATENWKKNVVNPEIDISNDFINSASPIKLINKNIPPFYIIHSKLDGLALLEFGINDFVEKLKKYSKNKVIFSLLNGAHHGFDHQNSLRVTGMNKSIQTFLENEYINFLKVAK